MNEPEQQWELRNITDESRVNDTVEQYKSLGFDVKVENFDPEKYSLDCNECMIETPERFKIIFTKPGANSGEGLFDE
jgi:hypothetical protein